MQDCMIDLETFGTRPGCVIRSIGACFFDPSSEALGAEFYINVDRADCEKHGLVVDPNTEAWWKRQSLAARAALDVDAQPLQDALRAFNVWWVSHSGVRCWSHGANFDQPILEACFDAVTMQSPWSFWDSRCTRTIYDVAGIDTRKMSAGEVKHNALDDARIQARAVQAAYRRINNRMAPAAPVTSNAGDIFS